MTSEELLERVCAAAAMAVDAVGDLTPSLVGLTAGGDPVNVVMLPSERRLVDRLPVAVQVARAYGADVVTLAVLGVHKIVDHVPAVMPSLPDDPEAAPAIIVTQASAVGCRELVMHVSVDDRGRRRLDGWRPQTFVGGPIHDILHDVTRERLTGRDRRRIMRRMDRLCRDNDLYVDPSVK